MAITLQKRQSVGDLFPDRAAYNLVRSFEGLALTAYPDPASELARTGQGSGDPWTAGYGSTGPHVTPGLRITLKTADDWLDADMAKAAAIVRASINVELTQSEFSALCCLAFNLGKIPPSIRAALNGGVTDKGVRLEPGSYGSALAQFPRNCRAGGIPMRGLLRRRLAEACLYSNLPWENACSINLVRLALTPTGDIDWNESTTLEDTLAFARQDIPEPIPPLPPISKPTFDPQWPRTELPPIVVAKPIPAPEPLPAPTPEPTITIITDIEKPAADLSPPAGAKVEPEPPTAPGPDPAPLTPSNAANDKPPPNGPEAAGAAGKAPSIDKSAAPTIDTGTTVRADSGAEREPAPSSVKVPAPPVPPPPPPKPPAPPVPIGQQTSAVNSASNSEDWSKGAKSLITSRRFWGLALVMFGRLWMMKTGSNAVLSGVSDPLVTEMFSGFAVMIVGELIEWWGRSKATRPLK